MDQDRLNHAAGRRWYRFAIQKGDTTCAAGGTPAGRLEPAKRLTEAVHWVWAAQHRVTATTPWQPRAGDAGGHAGHARPHRVGGWTRLPRSATGSGASARHST